MPAEPCVGVRWARLHAPQCRGCNQPAQEVRCAVASVVTVRRSSVCVPSLAIAALALAACTGSSNTSDSSASSSAPASSTTSAPSLSPAQQSGSATTAPATTSTTTSAAKSSVAATSAGYEATLDKIVLKASDLPASWKTSPAQADPSEGRVRAKAGAELARCAGGKDNTADELTRVDSAGFSSQDFTVSSSATRLRSTSDIDADVALLHRPKIAACFKAQGLRQIKMSLPAGAKLGTMSVVVHSFPRRAADHVVGTLNASIPVTVQGQNVTVYTDSVFVTGPLVEAEVDFEGIGSPVSPALQAKLTKIVADRAARS